MVIIGKDGPKFVPNLTSHIGKDLDTVIKEIMQSMLPFLDNAQLLQLQAVLSDSLAG